MDTGATAVRLRVLVVDDEPAVRHMLRAALEGAGFAVAEATHGAECLAHCAALQPDAIVLDTMMPVLDGFETCARLRELPGGNDLPVLMITSLKDAEAIERAFASGVTDIIAKPLHPTVLAQRLRYAVRARHVDVLLREAEANLQHAKLELEARVAELHTANEHLRAELASQRHAQAQLAHEALHDALTGLPNRTLFIDRLSHALGRVRRHSEYTFAVLFLDLDRFKTINDSLGHMAGDKLLVETARRLQACVRPNDTVSRIGGDEFAILLDDIGDVRGVTKVATRIHTALNQPCVIESHEVVSNTSIGIALNEAGYTHPDEMLRDADIAMYRAKSRGMAGYEIFRPEMHNRAIEDLRLEMELRRAIEQCEFVIHYQPIITAVTGQIVRVEALLRWQHPERGLIGPSEFMHAADEAGLMVLMGEWVLRTACAQVRAWQEDGIFGLRLSVNLSTSQFKHKELSKMVARVLAETRLPGPCLDLELTESSLMGDADVTAATLQELDALGVQLSLDNFGTGYSSLNSLKRFPLRTVKIDRSFIGQLTTSPTDAGIARAIIAMAHPLNLNVVAEGVETEAQLDFLRPYSCDSVQGFFLSPPLSVEAMTVRLREGLQGRRSSRGGTERNGGSRRIGGPVSARARARAVRS
jgi:diguanylate cyclase (GGDEF)-like protein